ncbi:hypothetical protein [Enterococcus thailandicus]|uniref:hypothetical protein n=1 Tax=Enterococcus thailandicus TaxID=417368 RepID=UPI0022EBE3BB|nr:hypothetical protein [Enterococcus thailandicus]MDA3976167.1 hypothetical protein [Enterococcus thailandicus]MDA3980707.1 hypothetical protein [Enterococcus thailandicus]
MTIGKRPINLVRKKDSSISLTSTISVLESSTTKESEPESLDGYTADTETVHGLNDPVTIFLGGKPAVTIEILKASAITEDLISMKNVVSYPTDTLIRLDIRMTNQSVKDFNDGSKSYKNWEIHTDNRTAVFPSAEQQPDDQPQTSPLDIETTGIVESYYVLDNQEKNTNVQELDIDQRLQCLVISKC